MPEKKPAKRSTQKRSERLEASDGFTDEERAAMKERARELKAARGRGSRATRADAEREVLAKLAEMPEPDRAMGERIHSIVMATAPELWPRLWYGMPAYAKDGKVLCFFQAASKFKARYATLGFSDTASLDDGALWPVTFALQELTPAAEKRIEALVRKAAG